MTIQKNRLGILVLVIIFGFLLRTPYFVHTLQDIDESVYAANAVTLMDGGRPYIDAMADNKPPGIFYIYYAIFLVFGKYNMLAVHLTTFLCTLATALTLGALARRMNGNIAALLTIAFYLTFTAALYPKMLAANTEIFMALPYALAVFLLYRAEETGIGYWYFFSGIVAGLVPLINQVGGIEIAAVLLYFLLMSLAPSTHGKGNRSCYLKFGTIFAVGFILPIAITGFLFYRHDTLQDAVFWTILYPLNYINQSSANLNFLSQLLIEFAPFVLSMPLVWITCILWTKNAVVNYKAAASSFSIFLTIWLITSIVATLVGKRMYGHYFIQILPPLCVTSALGASRFFTVKSDRFNKYWRIAIVTLTILPGIVFTSMALSFEAATDTWGELNPDFLPATEYIKMHTDPMDRIFVWGWFPPVYVYSERSPATRFVNTTMFVQYRQGNDPNEADRSDITWATVPAAWSMLKTDLERNHPKLIIDTSPGDYHDFGRYPLRDYSILREYVDANCHLENSIVGMDIYRCENDNLKTTVAGAYLQ